MKRLLIVLAIVALAFASGTSVAGARGDPSGGARAAMCGGSGSDVACNARW
jgi:hypothetical protein